MNDNSYPGGWFGESWGASVCDPDRHMDTPVGDLCAYCDKTIQADDQGHLLPLAGEEPRLLAYHHQCLMKNILGPAAKSMYSDKALAKQTEVERKRAAGEPILLSDLEGTLTPRDPREFRYGACPQQVEGVTAEGRPFYFRERHGDWTLDVGEVGWGSYLKWPSRGRRVVEGSGSISCDEIDALIDLHLGVGWAVA